MKGRRKMKSHFRARDEVGLRLISVRPQESRKPKISPRARIVAVASAALFLVALLNASTSLASSPDTGFGFHARDIAGAPTGAVNLTGGGSFDPTTGVGHAGGGFRCVSDVNQGPLTGCLTGQGVRWDTDALLRSTAFKCTGSAGEALKSASTGQDTIVVRGDFYRAGDGNDESFKANLIVSANDIAPDLPGVQNVWVQGVGCATAVAHFSS
jgi:hypothetical protein